MRKTLDIATVEFASFPQRIGARIIDFFLASLFFAIFLQLTNTNLDPEKLEKASNSGDLTLGLGLWILLLPLIFMAYEIPTLANNGVTIGKRIMGICVVRTDGLIGIGLDRAALRVCIPMFVAMIPLINFLFLVGQFWFVYDPLRQNIPDKIARTYVIRTPSGLFRSRQAPIEDGE